MNKREYIDKLLAAWIANPEMRLGQLIHNAMYKELLIFPTEAGGHPNLFYVEDSDLIGAISKY